MKIRAKIFRTLTKEGKVFPCARTSLRATPSAERSPQRLLLLFLCFFLLLVTSCVSMQDDVNLDNASLNSEVSAFEKRFSEIDAAFFASDPSVRDKKLVQKTEILIADLEKSLKDMSLKKAFAARLYALEGLAFFDLQNKSQAKKNYEASLQNFKGDVYALILASRLGIEKNLADKAGSVSEKQVVLLELAKNHYAAQEYAAATAKFDEAFLSLEPFYRSVYKDLRDTSWNLRSLTKDPRQRNSQLLALKSLSVMQMILIANGDPELLFNYTAGKEVPDKLLYAKIAGSGLLNPVSKPLDAENAVTKNSAATRLIAARFLWNLYNQRRNTPQLATKYSEAYKNKKRSPILDVKLDSPDFDAVLGCVENEIMHLEDGIEFGGNHEISGVEFDESLMKIK